VLFGFFIYKKCLLENTLIILANTI